MKNNEILVSVKIENGTLARTFSFLVIKDTTLKAFFQGVKSGPDGKGTGSDLTE